MTTIIVKDLTGNGSKGVTADVRGKMVQHMVLLLARKGLQGASFSEILQASGAPRGSLYHHFPGGKEELVLAALDEARETAASFLRGFDGRPPAEVVSGFAALWRSVLAHGNLEAGCAVVAVTVAAGSPALLERAGEIFADWRARLAELLAQGGLSAERAPGLAALLISACEGATALARAEKSFAPFDLAVAELQRMVEEANCAGT